MGIGTMIFIVIETIVLGIFVLGYKVIKDEYKKK